MKKILIALAFCAFTLNAFGEGLYDTVRLRIDHEDGIYRKGETVRVWADVTKVPEDAMNFHIMKDGNIKPVSTEPVTLVEGENLLFEETINESVHYFFALNNSEKVVFKSLDNVSIGLVVGAEDFKLGFDEPSDLLSFWNREIKAMRKKKIKSKETVVEGARGSEGYEVREVEISCVGPKPVRGYMAWPAGAEKKSLPIIVFLHAAGSNESTSAHVGTALSYAKMGALAIDINAHGMLNQQPKEYYKELYTNGELKGYQSREPEMQDYYFKWMFLRAQRTVDFMAKNPLWDGKHIIVTGTSQGGGQSAFLAGIDPRVTACVLTVPAMLDQGASLKGRANSWPKTMNKYPESTKQFSPYFDPALLMKYTKADVWCEIGLFDTTCPAANLFATMNTVTTAKEIVTFQRGHTSFNGGSRKGHAPVEKARNEYIKAQLVK